MPFIDLNSHPDESLLNGFEIVVIGAGAAGILLAVKLAEKGKNVLLIESGHFSLDDSRQSLNEVKQTGKYLSNAVWGRKRVVGGTTVAWGGQSLPFSPLDFEQRDWVANSGWPIGYSDLAAYYNQANDFMKIDTMNYEEDIFCLLRMKRPEFDQNLIRYHFSKWAPQPDFKKLYGERLEKTVTLVYNAVLTGIHLDEQGRADYIQVSNFSQLKYAVKSPQLVIAAGAIESNRILLTNAQQVIGGIGNHSGWLGKCFMDHPCTAVGTVETYKPFAMQYYFNTHVKNRLKYSIRMSASEQLQKQNQILNGSAGIMFAYAGDEMDPYQEIRRFLRTRKAPSVIKMAGNVNTYIRGAYALMAKKFIYKHRATARLVLMLEQEPVRESYIGLSDEKDRFGIPRAQINWVVTKKTWRTVTKMAEVLTAEIKRLGLGTVVTAECISNDNPDWDSNLTDVNHHMGGARMSADALSGVVNKELQVWGHDNIYLCSTAVFPTGSHSNPTLTLLALAQRLADKLSLTNLK